MRISKGKALNGLMLKGGVSALALTAFAAVAATPVVAQDAPAEGDAAAAQEVVVVGVRRSLKTAQQIKKDADTVVDSITANDIGSFPDKSVAEALQRVAGITVNRFAATGDTAHFSAEPSGVVVRGLQQVRSEFNGRDLFTADSSRGLSWSDVSPELMGGVDVYKNQTAELIEGGIAGTVNLRTRLPFDQKGRVLAATAEWTRGDLAEKDAWAFSGIYSDRFETDIGEFGLMVNGAHSQVVTNSQGIQFGRYAAVVSPAFGATGAATWDNPGKVYLPGSASIRDNTYDRVRDGVAIAAQWQSNDNSMVLTMQYNQSKKREQWEEHVIGFGSGTDSWAQPLTWVSDGTNGSLCKPGSTCTFNSDGGLEYGTLVRSIDAWMGDVQANTDATNPGGSYTCYQWTCGEGTDWSRPFSPAGYRGTDFSAAARYSDSVNDTRDVSLNFKWNPTDRLKLNFDVQKVEATQTNYDIETNLRSYADVTFDLTGDHPVFTIAPPSSFNDAPNGVQNVQNYASRYIMDHVTDSDGEMFAARVDLAYSFDSPWLNTLKAGVRFADREQDVRWTTYNWKQTTNDWENFSRDNYFVTGSVFPGGLETYQLKDDFYGGGVANASTGGDIGALPFYAMDIIKDRAGLAAVYGNQSYAPVSTAGVPTNVWQPICYRPGEEGGGYEAYNAATAGPDVPVPTASANTGHGCFKPSELSAVQEKTKAAYLQLKFGGPDATIFGGWTVVGNVGVRYVETQNISTGGVNYGQPTYGISPTSPPPMGSPPGTPAVYNWSYFVPGLIGTPPAVTADQTTEPALYAEQVALRLAYVNNPANFTEDRAFAVPSTEKVTTDITHKHWLPSFNVRLGITDQWFLRFAASRALSRPDIGNLKAYSSVSMAQPSTADLVCGKAFECTAGVPTKANVRYTGSAQNPLLKPVTADQVDLSVENYFSSTGSVTFNLFYKKFHDYIQFGSYYRNYTNNGVTREVLMNGPVNGDGASIKGFEIAYQSFFDFLPAPWDGFGVQANYTHLANSGINSAAVARETAGDDGSSDPGTGGISRSANSFLELPLEGLSDDSYNLILMYEKGQWSARLAYNWRSRFMVTAQDCCTTFPVWQKDAGYLDARLAYRINDNIEVSLEGSNLLSTETLLQQQVDGPTTTYPDREARFLNSSWFKNDRRLQASVRLKY